MRPRTGFHSSRPGVRDFYRQGEIYRNLLVILTCSSLSKKNHERARGLLRARKPSREEPVFFVVVFVVVARTNSSLDEPPSWGRPMFAQLLVRKKNETHTSEGEKMYIKYAIQY
jgi:hypothetical protein